MAKHGARMHIKRLHPVEKSYFSPFPALNFLVISCISPSHAAPLSVISTCYDFGVFHICFRAQIRTPPSISKRSHVVSPFIALFSSLGKFWVVTSGVIFSRFGVAETLTFVVVTLLDNF
ncbi:hypothetical protein CIPAW_11G078200 [Carya illinoinensis]|uniref:Uncharacterized protein n=1 Tax=Carya illinoinensis TaxID=32201 RepID=A0A8T1P102_CARIL|nr:hypothetical protein CIPAW_11G078200 [Carya illinoinensis]